MAVDYASFVAEFAEFDALPQALVETKLVDADLMQSEAAWGDLYDLAVKYMTAHLLGMTPEGENMALKNDDGVTIYLSVYKQTIRARNSRRVAVL